MGKRMSDDEPQEVSEALMRAAAQMAIWGPCRQSGDNYLACVAIKSKGQCQSLRHMYEACMRTQVDEAFGALQQLGESSCGHLNTHAEKLECAAKYVNGQAGASAP